MAQERQLDNPIDVAEGRLVSKDGGRCTRANSSSTGNELDGTHHDARGLTTEITLFWKTSGILSKRIYLGAGGKPVADGDACEMWDGWAERRTIGDLDPAGTLARTINSMTSAQALATGRLVEGVTGTVPVVVERKLEHARKLRPNAIARTQEFVQFAAGPGWMLGDHDRKGMTAQVAETLDAAGGCDGALRALIPSFDELARVYRASTSSELCHAGTGEVFPNAGGRHDYILLLDQRDAPRVATVLHKRAWNARLGWIIVGAKGEKLERSVFDRAAVGGERLVFEGAPVVEPPLAQNAEARKAIAYRGRALDSRKEIPDLTAEEEARYRQLVAAAKAAVEPEAKARRDEWLRAEGARLGERGEEVLRLALEQHALTGDFVLQFDDAALGSPTVDEVLADPARYHGKSMPDPIEGFDYGRGKAKLYVNEGGSVIINSFAHGGRVFRLIHSSEEEVRDRQVEEDFAKFLPGGEFFNGNATGGQSAPGSDDAQKAKSWRSKLLLTQKGERRICEHNIGLVLESDPALVGRLALNLMGQRIMARNLPWHDGCDAGEWQPWGDADDVELACYLQSKHGIFAGPKIVSGAIIAHAKRNAVHPLRDILNGLAWDGVRRLETWTSTYLGAEDTPYTRAVGKRWTIAAVARVMEPGCKADCALILEGAQGARKSTAAGVLAIKPEWFADELAALGSKDAAQDMVGKWIIELAELSAIRTNAAVENVKAFVSRRVDRYRPSYGRYSQDFPRQCVFIGTTNADTYLVDETGNRRYWPVRVGEIKLEDLRRDVLQLWAEAVALYRAGERWYLTHDEETTLARPEQAKRRESDVWKKCISDHLAKCSGPVTVEGILTDAVKMPVERQEAKHQVRVGRVLKALGYERRQKRVNGARDWFYFPAGYDDTAATESQNGATAEADNIVRLPGPQAPHAGSRTSVEKDLAAYLTDTSVADELSALK